MPKTKLSSKKQSLQLEAPPASESEDEQLLEITVTTPITTVSAVTISESFASVEANV